MSSQKDENIKEAVQNVVRLLLSLDVASNGEVVCAQCKRVAIELGNLLAPKIYGSGIHGVGNAISCAIRVCSEALFWLDLSQIDNDECVKEVQNLRDILSTPRCG